MTMAFTRKYWTLDSPITVDELNRIERGIDVFSTASVGIVNFMLATDTAVSVVGSTSTYNQPATPINIFSITPSIESLGNCKIVLGGYITLKFGSNIGTPDLTWGIVDGSGIPLLGGPLGNRSRESLNQPVGLPIGGLIELTAGETTTARLAVASSVAGTVTIMGSGRTRVTGIICPQ